MPRMIKNYCSVPKYCRIHTRYATNLKTLRRDRAKFKTLWPLRLYWVKNIQSNQTLVYKDWAKNLLICHINLKQCIVLILQRVRFYPDKITDGNLFQQTHSKRHHVQLCANAINYITKKTRCNQNRREKVFNRGLYVCTGGLTFWKFDKNPTDW